MATDSNERDFQRERYLNRHRMQVAQAGLNYSLECFGDHLAKQKGYKNLDGFDALRYYLMEKHHWLPAPARALSMEDLAFALHQERQGWTLPKAALQAEGRSSSET